MREATRRHHRLGEIPDLCRCLEQRPGCVCLLSVAATGLFLLGGSRGHRQCVSQELGGEAASPRGEAEISEDAAQTAPSSCPLFPEPGWHFPPFAVNGSVTSHMGSVFGSEGGAVSPGEQGWVRSMDPILGCCPAWGWLLLPFPSEQPGPRSPGTPWAGRFHAGSPWPFCSAVDLPPHCGSAVLGPLQELRGDVLGGPGWCRLCPAAGAKCPWPHRAPVSVW